MKENIEEDIKILEDLRIANENCIRNSKIKDSPFIAIWEKQNNAIEHILSDYKRVLKENEINEFQEQQLKYYIEELKKYDIRNFKLDDNEQIKSISFTKEQLEFMNLGIALYKNIDKILNDKSEEE